ncbi:MAG: RpiB/LacA/LacB family sugar-phosphate isomerase [Malacoplasma sp.]
MIIAFGCDHSFFSDKDEIIDFLKSKNCKVIDCGTYSCESTHYAIYGHKVASLVALKKVDFGIVICGTNIGISNSAQKTKGARVVATRHPMIAIKARELYNANILAIGGRVISKNIILELIESFLSTKYLHGQKDEIKLVDSLIKHDNFDSHIFDQHIKALSKK